MTTRTLTPLLAAPLLLALTASGCAGDDRCQRFAEHRADVLAKEKGESSAENREKMIKATAKTCGDTKPKPETLDCALKAETSAAIKACQPKDEKADEKAEKAE